MIGAFRSVYRSKVSTCIVEYVGQYCESKSVCCLSVDVVDESFVSSKSFCLVKENYLSRPRTTSEVE